VEGKDRHIGLLQQLRQKWPLTQLDQQVGAESFQLWYVHEVDQLLNDLLAKGDDHPDVKDERLPYWADIWASAIGLSEFILENKAYLKGKKVLEIGCGIGLPGIVAARCGASVYMTDYLEDALQLAQLNWFSNTNEQGHFELMDWREPQAHLKADIVLASDVAYEERAFQPLLSAFPNLVREKGEIWISEPNRAWAKPFFKTLDQKGWLAASKDYAIQQEGLASRVTVSRIRLGE
jgi:predicted nicotinamide N-methyase